jgi:SAM-dependent methyltransferase
MWRLPETPGSYIIDRRRRSIDIAHNAVAPIVSVAECVVSEEFTVWIGEFERAAVVPKSFSVGNQEFRRLLDCFHLPAVPDSALSVALFDLCADAYERLVDVTRNVSNIHNLLRVAIATLTLEAEPVRVLDFGCGTGLSVVALQSFVSSFAGRIQLAGTDRSLHMLEIAARRRLPVLAVADLDANNKRVFDAVVASYVIHLGLSQDDCNLIAKQLAPGGVFVANYHHGDAASVAQATSLLSATGLRAMPLPSIDAGTPANLTLLFGKPSIC